MVKQAKKKNHDFFQVYGINGTYNIVQAKKLKMFTISTRNITRQTCRQNPGKFPDVADPGSPAGL